MCVEGDISLVEGRGTAINARHNQYAIYSSTFGAPYSLGARPIRMLSCGDGFIEFAVFAEKPGPRLCSDIAVCVCKGGYLLGGGRGTAINAQHNPYAMYSQN